MGDGTEFDDALLGLSGLGVLAVTDDGDELLVGIETICRAGECSLCGVIARTKIAADIHRPQSARAYLWLSGATWCRK
jgi:hypothetical protein